MTDLRTIVIDDRELEVPGGMTLIQACEEAGIEIPRFCYHERLSIAGNCRMCLVEVVGGPPKPTASCAMQVRDLRPGPEGQPPVVRTNSPMAVKARQGVMEFLLINHPLDCPICDQGGECDLQDQAMAYGVDFSRYREPKRAMDDLDLGPLVETHMTRCISCTRCVRFTTEVAGISQMGQTGRGEDSEITTYLNQTLDSNLQGNIIDLCPVGALTSKPYAFTARPWELTKTETVDVMDAMGSNIRVDCKGSEIMRILPRNHDGVNEEWISDKTRFVWDGLRCQRLDRPYVRRDGKLCKSSWEEALSAAASALAQGPVVGLAGELVPVEAVYALGRLMDSMGGRKECRVAGEHLPVGNRSGYAGTAAIAGIDTSEQIILVGTNPRVEMPVLNARIRMAWLEGTRVSRFGPPAELTYGVEHSGEDLAAFRDFARRATASDCSGMLVILGTGALADSNAALAISMELAAAGAGLLVLHQAAARVGAMDVGFCHDGGMSAALEDAGTVFNLGMDETDIGPGPFVIYQGSHGDRGAHRADVILPAAAYTEENGIFVNTEGRPQLALKSMFPPGEAKENWSVVRALSEMAGHRLPFNTIDELRRELTGDIPHLMRIDEVPRNSLAPIEPDCMDNFRFSNPAGDCLLSNPVARASRTMAELAMRTGAHGKMDQAA